VVVEDLEFDVVHQFAEHREGFVFVFDEGIFPGDPTKIPAGWPYALANAATGKRPEKSLSILRGITEAAPQVSNTPRHRGHSRSMGNASRLRSFVLSIVRIASLVRSQAALLPRATKSSPLSYLGKISFIMWATFSPVATFAETRSWLVSSGTWSTDANWSGGVAPSDADTVVIRNSGTAVLPTGVTGYHDAFYIGGISSGTGAIVISGGLLEGRSALIGNGPDTTGSATVTSGTWGIENDLVVGGVGTGNLLINGGYISNNFTYLGYFPTGVGNVTVTSGTWVNGELKIGVLTEIGTGAGHLLISGGYVSSQLARIKASSATVSGGTWSNATSLTVDGGSNGSGTLLISGGYVSSPTATINAYIYGTSSVTVTGGSWDNTRLDVGVYGTGNLLINGGYVYDVYGSVGLYPGAVGNVTVTSGTWNTGFELSIGYNGDGNLLINGGYVYSGLGTIGNVGEGSATVTSGTWSNGSMLLVGNSGTGTLNISGGLVSVSGTAFTAHDATGRGTINLSGSGTLSTIQMLEGAGAGVINIDGGVLQARADESDFLSGYEAGDLTIQAGGAFIDSGSYAIGINPILSGTGGLTKRGSGTLTLTGSNSYSGATTVSAGSLKLTENSSSPAFAIATGAILYLDVASGSRSFLSATGAVTFSGSGNIVKTGNGSARWDSVAATFALGSGSLINVQEGVFVGGSFGNEVWTNNKSDLNVAAGARFNGAEADVRVDALTGLGTIQSGFSGSYQNFTFGVNDGSGTFGGVLANNPGFAGNFVKAGMGTQTLTGSNTYTGYTTVKNGTLAIASGGSLTHPDGDLKVGETSGDNGALLLNGGSITSDQVFVGYLSGATGSAVLNSGSWNYFVFYLGENGTGTLSVNSGAALSGIAAGLGNNPAGVGVATVAGGTWNNSGDLSIGNFGRGTLSITSGAVSAATAYLGVGSGAVGVALVSGGTWANSADLFVGYQSTGTLAISGGVVTGSLTWVGAFSGGKGTLNISGSSGNRGTLQTGRLLEGSGTGRVNFDGGILRAAGNDANFVSGFEAGEVTINAGGALVDSNGFAIAITSILSGTGGLTKQGAGALTLSASNTYTGGTVINSGTVFLGHANGLGATSGSLTITNGTLNVFGRSATVGGLSGSSGAVITSGSAGLATLTINQSGSTNYAGNIVNGSGTMALTKQGAGTLTLSGSNTYTGSTIVSAGRLLLTDNSNSSAFAIASGAALEFSVASGSRDGVANTVFSGSGTLVKSGAGTAFWSASANFDLATGSLIDVQAGVLLGGSHGNEVWTTNKSDLNVAGGAQFNGVEANVRVDALTGAGTVQSGFSGGYQNMTFGVDNGSGTFSGVLANNPGFTANYVKAGTGTQILTGSNSYTGTTTLSSGTLQIGDGGLAGTLGSGAVVNNASLVINRSGSMTMANAMSGSGALTINGAGTVTLTGSNTYTGFTTVKSGTLAVGGGGSITHSGGALTLGDVSGDKGALLLGGGNVTSSLGVLGWNAGSRGTATVSSGRWTTNAELIVGYSGTGNLLVNGGNVSSNGALVGYFADGVGTATVSSGTWANSSIMYVGYNGSGNLAISGGLVNAGGSVFTGYGTSGIGGITLSGSSGNRGILLANRVVRGDGSGSLNFNGGVLQARTNESNFLSGYDADDVTIGSGGAFIDSNGFDVGASTTLSGTGGLTKQGAGTLRLSGSSGYSGGTTVTSGTLAAANSRAVGTSIVRVEGGVFLIEQGISVANSVTLAGGSLAQEVAAGTDLTTLKTFTDGVAGGITTVSQLLNGTTSAGATITSGFAATSSALNDEIRLSDVFHFSGVPVIGPGGATDIFVLQLSVSGLTANSYLGWLDPDTNTWVNAVVGNIGGTATPFTRGYNPLTDFHLGYYGVDVGSASVWVVVNHNSDFGVVPEPGSLALAGLGLGLLFLRRRRSAIGRGYRNVCCGGR